MDVLADARELGVRPDHVLAHVRGMRARVADALDAGDRVDGVQELRELARLRAQAEAVAVDVLPSSVTSLTPSAASRSISATSSSNGRLTSRPRVVGTMQNAHFMLQPAEICTHPWNSRSRLAGRWP